MNEEKLAAYYIGLYFLKDDDHGRPYDAQTLRSIVHGKIGKKVAYKWMENMYENHKFLFKNMGGNDVSRWGKVSASCSEPVFKANMLALADNVVILEEKCNSMEAINPDLKWGSRGTSIRLVLEGLILKTKREKSFQSLISVGDVMFSVFFQMEVYKLPEKATIEMRLFVTPEKNIIAKVQTVNSKDTIEASITHALSLKYYLDKMTKAGVSSTHLNTHTNPNALLSFRNKNIQNNSKSVPSIFKSNSDQRGACYFEQSAFLEQDNERPAVKTSPAKFDIADDSDELYESDETLTDPILVNDIPTQPVIEEVFQTVRVNEEKLAAFYIGLHFLKEFGEKKIGRVRLEAGDLIRIIQERIRENIDFKWMEKMFENHKYLFKNMGCNSLSKWGNITTSCSEPVFKVYLLALADNVETFEGQKSTLNKKSVLKWGRRGTSIDLSNLKGLLQWTNHRNILFALIFVEDVIFSLPFQLEYSMITEQVSLEVRLFVNAQKNIIARVHTVNGKETIEASITHPLSLQFYKEMRNKAGVPKVSLMKRKNAKGFIISKNVDCGSQKASTSKQEGISLADRSNQASVQQVFNNKQSSCTETEESYEEDTDEIYESDVTPTDSTIEDDLLTNPVSDEDIPVSSSVVDNLLKATVTKDDPTTASIIGDNAYIATNIKIANSSATSSHDDTSFATITSIKTPTTIYVKNENPNATSTWNETSTATIIGDDTSNAANVKNVALSATDNEELPTANTNINGTSNESDNAAISNLKLKYKKDHWSPKNPTGKKVYSRDFLVSLQLVPNSMKRPVISDNPGNIVKDKPRQNLPIQKMSLPSGFKLRMKWETYWDLNKAKPKISRWSLEEMESLDSLSYESMGNSHENNLSEKQMETFDKGKLSEKQFTVTTHKSLPMKPIEEASDQINLPITETQSNGTLCKDGLIPVKDIIHKQKPSYLDQQYEHRDSFKQEKFQDLCFTNGPLGGWKTSSGQEMSIMKTNFECVDWKESSSRQINGVKEIEVVIRGKVKLGPSQQLIAINDMLGNVIISAVDSNQ